MQPLADGSSDSLIDTHAAASGRFTHSTTTLSRTPTCHFYEHVLVICRHYLSEEWICQFIRGRFEISSTTLNIFFPLLNKLALRYHALKLSITQHIYVVNIQHCKYEMDPSHLGFLHHYKGGSINLQCLITKVDGG